MKAGIERVHFLDFVRGVAILGMIVHHGAFDLMSFYGFDFPIFESLAFEIVQTVFVLAFIILSGVCTGFSRSPLRRGLIVLGGAVLVSGVTYFVTPELPIRFGILHFMGCAMVLYALCRKALEAIPAPVGCAVFGTLFIAARIFFPITATVPFLYPFGLVAREFVSADYYPLIPWLFAFFFGTYFSRPILAGRAPGWFYRFRCPFVNFCGRNTLWIFLLHQPVLIGVFYLLFNVLGVGGR